MKLNINIPFVGHGTGPHLKHWDSRRQQTYIVSTSNLHQTITPHTTEELSQKLSSGRTKQHRKCRLIRTSESLYRLPLYPSLWFPGISMFTKKTSITNPAISNIDGKSKPMFINIMTILQESPIFPYKELYHFHSLMPWRPDSQKSLKMMFTKWRHWN